MILDQLRTRRAGYNFGETRQKQEAEIAWNYFSMTSCEKDNCRIYSLAELSQFNKLRTLDGFRSESYIGHIKSINQAGISGKRS